MRQVLLFLIIWLLALLCLASHAQPLPPRSPACQAATIQWLVERLSIREATGRNDGPKVAALVTEGGGRWREHPEWCGFTQAADQKAHGLPIPANGMQGAAAAWFRDPRRTTYLAGVRGALAESQPGDVVGFNYGRGIHHITRLKQVVPPERKGRPPRGFYTLGGNEGRGANAGLHLTYYAAPAIAATARWDYSIAKRLLK